MKLGFTPEAWEHYLYWQQTDRAMVKRINKLLQDTSRSPFSGIGKPEPLKNNLSGLWSRRIDQEHRLVYGVESDDLLIYSCRFHYDI